jgi:hypothetical protein
VAWIPAHARGWHNNGIEYRVVLIMLDIAGFLKRCNWLARKGHIAAIVLALILSTRCSLCTEFGSSSPSPLRTADSVLALTREQATHKYPVQLRGVVTFT